MGYGIPRLSLDPGDRRFAHALNAHSSHFVEGLPRHLEAAIGRSGCRTERSATGLAEKTAASALLCRMEGMAADIPFAVLAIQRAIWIQTAPIGHRVLLHETCFQGVKLGYTTPKAAS